MADAQGSGGECGLYGAPFPFLGGAGRYGIQRRRPDDRLDLRQIVARQVIPRLRGIRAPRGRHDPAHARPIGVVKRATRSFETDRAALIDRLLKSNLVGARALIDQTRERGGRFESVCLDIIQPAADRLQDLWRDDRLELAEATLALLDLRALLLRMTDDWPADPEPTANGRRVLLASSRRPGDIGALVIAQTIGAALYRHGGWDTWIEQDRAGTSRADTIRRYWFDIVELFVDAQDDPDALAASIRAIRLASPNPGLGILLRVANFSGNPNFDQRVGADLASRQPRASLMFANQFVAFPHVGKESSACASVSGADPARQRKIRLT